MNINTLNSEPLTSKTGKLAIALYPNTLAAADDGKSSYYARVINRSRLRQDDIVDDIVANGSSLSKEEIARAWRLINNAVTCRLTEGISVDTGLGLLRPAVTGVFDSASSEFDRKRNAITVQYRPDRQLRDVMASLTPVIAQGNRVIPEITSVLDKSLPPEKDGCLCAGGFFSIRGKNIMVADDDGTDENASRVGLYFDNLDDAGKSVRLVPSQIYHNSAVLLEGIIPQLADGRYRVRVVTKYCKSKYRKTEQEHCFDRIFTVGTLLAQAEQSGGDSIS